MVASKKVKVSKLRIPANYSLEVNGITQSIIQDWMKCDQMLYFTLNRWHKKSKIKKTSFGIAGHFFLEAIYNYLNIATFNDKNLNKILNNSINFYFEENEESLTNYMSSQDVEIMKFQLTILLKCYVQKYRAELYNLKNSVQEKQFNYKFHNFLLRGKIDRLVIQNKKVFIFDHKFMSRIGNDEELIALLSHDFQTKFYLYVVSKLYPDYEIGGLIYSIIRKSSIKPKKETKKKPAETILEFFSRISKDINDQPNYYFKRFTIKYTPRELKHFEKQLTMKLASIYNLLCSGQNKEAMQRETQCQTYYGKCDFLNGCNRNFIDLEIYEQGEQISPELDKS